MAETGGQVILKVLSGAQYGVEVALSDGEYSFGSGPEADLSFTDIALSDIHGYLRVAGGKLELKAAQGVTETASGLRMEPGEDSWHEIAQLDMVSAGTISFALGAPEARWSDLVGGAARPSGQFGARSAGSGNRTGSGSRVPLVLAVVAVAAVSAGVAYMIGGERRLPVTVSGATLTDLEVVRAAIDNLSFPNTLTVAEEVDGRIVVSGYVPDAPSRRAVENALIQTGAPVARRLWSLESLEADVSGLISASLPELEHEVRADGVVVLSGISLDGTRVADLAGLIEQQVFGVSAVENRVRTAQTFLAEVRALIEQVTLSELVLARLDGNLIETTGVVPLEKTDNWVGFVRAYSTRYADVLPLRSFVTLESDATGPVTEPLVLGAGDRSDLPSGRRLPSDAFAPGSELDAAQLFARAGGDGSGLGTVPGAGDGTEGENVESLAGDENGEVPENVRRVIEDFAARNPSLVQAIIRSVGAGEIPGITLPGAPDVQTAGAVEASGQVSADGSNPAETGSGESLQMRLLTQAPTLVPDSGSRLATAGLMRSVPIGAGSTGAGSGVGAGSDATAGGVSGPGATPPGNAGQRLTGSQPLAGTGGGPAVPSPAAPGSAGSDTRSAADAGAAGQGAAASSADAIDGPPAVLGGFTVFPTNYRPVPTMQQLQRALEGVFSQGGAVTDLIGLSPDWRALLDRQAEALEQGVSLLEPPQRLSALPRSDSFGRNTCWDGSEIDVEMLPTVLVWLDLLSFDQNADLARLSRPLQRLLFEAALTPERLRTCLRASNTLYARLVERNSTFLAETARNPSFGDYLFRNVPRYSLPVVGLNLAGPRYIQLPGGSKFREGAAPEASARLEVIGDLGAVIRVADGYQVTLYPDRIDWRVDAGN